MNHYYNISCNRFGMHHSLFLESSLKPILYMKSHSLKRFRKLTLFVIHFRNNVLAVNHNREIDYILSLFGNLQDLEYRKHMPSPDESISLRRRCRTISSFLKKTYQLLKVRFLWPRMSEPGCRAMGAQRHRFHRPQRRYFLQSGAPPATSSTATTPPSSDR